MLEIFLVKRLRATAVGSALNYESALTRNLPLFIKEPDVKVHRVRDGSPTASVHGTKTVSAMGFFNDSRKHTTRSLGRH
ncbi:MULTISPECIES: hypothetical protein [unclassified Sphingobium]|uniref:hypothetical protein n=1 Tax=unclassified Sphingobium TaxID=2611147 RepID=UPI001648A3FB|nr:MULTISPECIES: hypothetical protein [unclassified Sphingobium]